jgi:hypothetical protein
MGVGPGLSIAIGIVLLQTPGAWAQTEFEPPRLPDGRPNLQGIWTASGAGAFNLEEHPASFGMPAGRSVIVDPPDGKLPYLPGMREKQIDNFENRHRDPVGRCNPHGPPRGVLPPFPFMIVQDGDWIVFLSETAHDVRIVPMDGRPHREDYWAWEGDSRGRWEADTLVIDVTGFNGKTWLDQAGNFVDENLHVVERFRMSGPDRIVYEATVDDPTVYARPWTMRVTISRQPDNVEIMEYACLEGERDVEHYPN